MALHQLSDELWRERRLLDLLLFKLEEQELLLLSGRDQWVGHATREVEAVLARIRDTELSRAVAADVVAALVGAPPCSSLPMLARHAPAPWDTLLTSHHEALLALTTAIGAVAVDNRALITSVQDATRQTLGLTAAGAAPPVDELEVALGPVSVSALLDQIALDLLAEPAGASTTSDVVDLRARQADLAGALRATVRAVQPSLQAFLA